MLLQHEETLTEKSEISPDIVNQIKELKEHFSPRSFREEIWGIYIKSLESNDKDTNFLNKRAASNDAYGILLISELISSLLVEVK